MTADPDVARSVEALAPFGKKYVDQLATAYLAFNEKSYLPIVFKMVTARIKKDSGRDLLSASTDRDSRFASPEFENSRANLAHSKRTDSPAAEEERRKPLGDRAQERTEGATKQLLRDEPQAGSGARPIDIGGVKPTAGPVFDADETYDFSDLLKKIGSHDR